MHIAENKSFYSNLTLCNKIYRRRFLSENAIVFLEGIYHEDQLYVIQSYLLANKISVIKDPYYFYRKQRDNQVSTLDSERIFEIFEIFRALDIFIEEKGFNEEIINDITEIKIQRLFYFYGHINKQDKRKLFDLMKKEFNRARVIKKFSFLSKTQYENYNCVKNHEFILANCLLHWQSCKYLIQNAYLKLKNMCTEMIAKIIRISLVDV